MINKIGNISLSYCLIYSICENLHFFFAWPKKKEAKKKGHFKSIAPQI